jgi:RHS repeat-associated protein
LSGNRTSEQIDTGMSQATFNNVNQLTSKTTGSGSMEFAGSLDKQATVTVGGNSATVNHQTTNFVGYTSVTSGTNVVPVVAKDYNNNSRTNKYQVVVTNNGVTKTITYDLNGNETNVVTATSTNSYQWDAMNRLVSVTSPTNQSLFTYDGLGRRVQIIEKTNGVAYATNKFIWDGVGLYEQRDNTGSTVTKRFFGEGEQINGTNYFFTRDHLGSVREMVNSIGAIQYRADYDPYGRLIPVQGTLAPDFLYAGMYYEAADGLNLTLYRAYSADLGRWLSRDPSGETSGLNLYDYVFNNPVKAIDFFGLGTWSYDVDNTPMPGISERAAIVVSYAMDSNEKKCCNSCIVKRAASGGIFSTDNDDPHPQPSGLDGVANSAPDQPGGLLGWGPSISPFFFHFTWTAICIDGPWAGKVLSQTSRAYQVIGWTGKFVGRPWPSGSPTVFFPRPSQ